MALSDLIISKLRNISHRFGYKPIAGDKNFLGKLSDVSEEERQQTDLHRFFYENDGPLVHKWRHYLEIYDRHLSRFRSQTNPPVRVLEIGVSHGGSLRLWRRYFGAKSILFGIDINPRCLTLDGRDGNVRIGSQADPIFLKKVVAEMGGLDVVIDDGSHIAAHQKVSFETLYPLLGPEGTYICEDLHTSYWRGTYEGGYRRKSSFIEIAKNIVDDIHADFHERGQYVPNANRTVYGIHFYNSIVVIEKRPRPKPVHLMIGATQS